MTSYEMLMDSLHKHNWALNKVFINSHLHDSFTRAVELLAIRILSGNKILICGNGGSAADAQHLAAELVVRYKDDRKPIPAISISTDTSVITAAYNDDYEVFGRQVEALGRPGDVLIAISTSGTSENIIQAIYAASLGGMAIIGLSGQHGFRDMHQPDINLGMDVELRVPSDSTNLIQEMHIIIYHALVEALESELKACESSPASRKLL